MTDKKPKKTNKSFLKSLSVIFLILIILIPFVLYIYSKQNSKLNSNGFNSHSSHSQLKKVSQNPQSTLLKKLNSRSSLSASDLAAKKRILSLIPNGQASGTVYNSLNFQIDYIQSEDVFQAEILTPSINQAKQDVVNWFKLQGLSMNGICNLPVEFYPSFNVKKSLTQPLNPLPVGC